MEQRDLLDDLMREVGCGYLSDLRLKQFQTIAVSAALAFPAEQYSVADWKDVVNYLLPFNTPVETREEARTLLETWSKQHSK